MTTVAEAEQEFHGHAIHVGHGQDVKQRVASLDGLSQTVDDKRYVAPYRAVGQHHALREAGGTAGVVDKCQFLGLVFVIMDVLLTEGHRVFFAKHHIKMFAGVVEFLRA